MTRISFIELRVAPDKELAHRLVIEHLEIDFGQDHAYAACSLKR